MNIIFDHCSSCHAHTGGPWRAVRVVAGPLTAFERSPATHGIACRPTKNLLRVTTCERAVSPAFLPPSILIVSLLVVVSAHHFTWLCILQTLLLPSDTVHDLLPREGPVERYYKESLPVIYVLKDIFAKQEWLVRLQVNVSGMTRHCNLLTNGCAPGRDY